MTVNTRIFRELSRCQNGGLSPYPEIRSKQLERLGVDASSITRCVKYLVSQVDPAELLRVRMRQKMELGRYGRQCVLQWDDVPLLEFQRYHKALIEVVNAENARTESIPGMED